VLQHAAPADAQYPHAVAIVDQNQGLVTVGEVADTVQLSNGPVHRENAVGNDHPAPGVGSLLQLGLKVGHVVVGVSEALGLTEPDAIDQRGMVQSIGDNRVLSLEQALEDTAVSIETGGIEDRILKAQKGCDLALQGAVLVLGSTDEADAGHTQTVAIETFVGSLYQVGVVGQAQIAVGAKIQDLAGTVRSLDRDLGALSGQDLAFALIETLSIDLL